MQLIMDKSFEAIGAIDLSAKANAPRVVFVI